MMHATSESDITSIGPSSASPRAYYVQSPSRDSHDDTDKFSSDNGDSPSDPRHSTTSSSSTAASRVFGNRRRWNKHYCNMVAEEEDGGYDDDYYRDQDYLRHCNIVILVIAFGLFFSGICLAVWSASTHYKPQVTTKSFRISSMYFGEGSDRTGVPTKLITVNCSSNLVIYNPATFFGVYITSHTADLLFSEITVASGQVHEFYQPRKSEKIIWVRLVGKNVPLYGAELALAAYDQRGGIPFNLEFRIQSKGYLMGRLLKTEHTVHFSCFLLINSHQTKQIMFHNNSCQYF